MSASGAWQLPAVVLMERNKPPLVRTLSIDPPGPKEVAVRLMASGICHTDIAAVRDARTVPIVLGHEGAGRVEMVGKDVQHVRVGDHVVINWQVKCGECHQCRSGRQAFCDGIIGTTEPRLHLDGQPVSPMLNAGTFSPIAIVPAGGAIPIPREVPFPVAAMLGCAIPTGVGATLYCARVAPGADVAVIGAGAVGLNIVQGAKLAQANIIIAIDPNEQRLTLARRLGATHLIDAATVNDPVACVREITHGRGVEHTFEAVGGPRTAQQGIEMLARGGTLTLLGAASRDASISFEPRRFMSQQQTICGCIYGNVRPAYDLPLFSRWYLDGRLEIDALLGRRITLQEVPKYFATGGPPASGIRTIVEFS